MKLDELKGFSETFEDAVLHADWLRDQYGNIAPKFVATVRLGRSLAQKLDKLEQHDWINAADKPDTTTVSQYPKVLDALKLNPSCDKSIKAEPQKKKSSSLAAFTSGFKVVNG